MSDGTSAWNMGDRFYLLITGIKEQYVTAVASEEPRAMLKWAECLADEIYPSCTIKEKKEIDKITDEARASVWASKGGQKGMYDDAEDAARTHYEAIRAASALYRALGQLMFDKKMVIPWEPKRDLGKASLELE